MKKVLAVLGFVLAVNLCAGTAVAQTLLTKVEVSASESVARIRYEFSKPAFSHRVTDTGDQYPKSADINFCALVHDECKSLNFAQGIVSASFPFSIVIATVHPASAEIDSVYPTLSAIDDRSSLLYAPRIVPNDYEGSIRLRKGNWIQPTDISREQARGYILIGDRPNPRDRLVFRFSDNVPINLQQIFRNRIEQIHQFYTARLGSNGHDQITIVVTYNEIIDPVSSSNRADVTNNGVMFFRIQKLKSIDMSVFEVSITQLMAHELFHLWQRFDTSLLEKSYLHEGQAEYASWLAMEYLWPRTQHITARVNVALDHCIRYLGPKPIVAMDSHSALNTRYSCGPIAQWLFDHEVRSGRLNANPNLRSIFELWRKELPTQNNSGLLEQAEASKPPTASALSAFLYGSGNARWSSIANRLNDQGLRLKIDQPSDFMRRVSILKPLVDSSCGFTSGIGEQDGEVFVESAPNCKAFGGRSIVLSLDGFSPIRDLDKLEERLIDVCKRKGSLLMSSIKAGLVAESTVPCLSEFNPAPPVLSVVEAFP